MSGSGTADVVLLRHAESTAPAGHAGGWTDWPLSPAGRAQAAALAMDWRGPPPARVIASDLTRAIETAAPLAARFGLAVERDPDWREVGLGEWEGRAWAEIEARDRARLAAWYADWRRLAPPGGEAWPDVIARVRRAWRRIVAAPGAFGPIVVVSHVGALRAWLVGCADRNEDRAMAWPLSPLGGIVCSLDEIARPPRKLWSKQRFRRPRMAGSRIKPARACIVKAESGPAPAAAWTDKSRMDLSRPSLLVLCHELKRGSFES